MLDGAHWTRNKASATAIMVLAGLVALGNTAWQGYEAAVFLRHVIRVEGVVVEPSGHPVIQFQTAAGATVKFRQNGFIARAAGAAVPVAYDPRDPGGTAQAATFWTTWGFALWSLPRGLGFTLLPLIGCPRDLAVGSLEAVSDEPCRNDQCAMGLDAQRSAILGGGVSAGTAPAGGRVLRSLG